MILTDHQILENLKQEKISITPIPTHHQIQPCSIDLRLGAEYLSPIKNEGTLNIRNEEPKYQRLYGNSIVLPPNEFILGTTKEKIRLSKDICATVEGRSSIGRLGIMIHVTAGFIDPAFEGNITLEIKNISNQSIMLHEDMRICQLVFHQLSETPKRVYGEAGNKYQGQEGVVGSLIYWDED